MEEGVIYRYRYQSGICFFPQLRVLRDPHCSLNVDNVMHCKHDTPRLSQAIHLPIPPIHLPDRPTADRCYADRNAWAGADILNRGDRPARACMQVGFSFEKIARRSWGPHGLCLGA